MSLISGDMCRRLQYNVEGHYAVCRAGRALLTHGQVGGERRELKSNTRLGLAEAARAQRQVNADGLRQHPLDVDLERRKAYGLDKVSW